MAGESVYIDKIRISVLKRAASPIVQSKVPLYFIRRNTNYFSLDEVSFGFQLLISSGYYSILGESWIDTSADLPIANIACINPWSMSDSFRICYSSFR